MCKLVWLFDVFWSLNLLTSFPVWYWNHIDVLVLSVTMMKDREIWKL